MCYGDNCFPFFVNNVIFAAAILFSGNNYTKIALLCKFLNLQHIKKQPTTRFSVRNDSPGHSAQYCLYTLMDTETKKIADIQVVDKRETGLKSAAMEKLGLQRGLHALAGTVNICELATDASTSIMAMLG